VIIHKLRKTTLIILTGLSKFSDTESKNCLKLHQHSAL